MKPPGRTGGFILMVYRTGILRLLRRSVNTSGIRGRQPAEMQRGLINAFELKQEEVKFQRWLQQASRLN